MWTGEEFLKLGQYQTRDPKALRSQCYSLSLRADLCLCVEATFKRGLWVSSVHGDIFTTLHTAFLESNYKLCVTVVLCVKQASGEY